MTSEQVSQTSDAAPPKTYLVAIDGLRGFFAIGILLYHGLYAEGVAAYERVAYYFVYGFFAISGASLYCAYADMRADGVLAYMVKRYFRIAPLFILVIILTALLRGVGDGVLERTFLNVTLLFGFANPGATSMVTGGWSIGIEFVYYFLFPVLLFTSRSWRYLLVTLFAATFALTSAFSNWVVDPTPGRMTSELWASYTQPVTFLSYFVFGLFLGQLRTKIEFNSVWCVILIAASMVIFCALPSDNPLELIFGWRQVVLAIAILAIVAGFAGLNHLPKPLNEIMLWAGRVSYSVYLLHPLVQRVIRQNLLDWGGVERTVLSLIVTSIIAWLVYRLLEEPVRDVGRRIAAKL